MLSPFHFNSNTIVQVKRCSFLLAAESHASFCAVRAEGSTHSLHVAIAKAVMPFAWLRQSSSAAFLCPPRHFIHFTWVSLRSPERSFIQ
jgi:hypothetical protein